MRNLATLCLASLPLAALAAGPFTLESAEIKPNSVLAEAQVYKGFGCSGGNVSPSLSWKNAPAGRCHRCSRTLCTPALRPGPSWA